MTQPRPQPVDAVPTATTVPHRVSLTDEHSLLLWQACAYVDDLTDATGSPGRALPTFNALLGFAHNRLLPYLAAEERQLPSSGLRDEHLTPVLLADHDRIRADVENVEASKTRRLLTLATSTLVARLEHHLRREESWVSGSDTVAGPTLDDADLLFGPVPGDIVDVDRLPEDERMANLLARLGELRVGQSLRLHATSDLHAVWRRHHALTPGTHAWVYEKDGPGVWVARITRRYPDGD